MFEFDEQWYLEQYPHVAEELGAGKCASAHAHYQLQGARQGLSPNGLFDEAWYRRKYPDVAAGIRDGVWQSGFEHYLAIGAGERRSPHRFFDESWYGAQYPEVADAIAKGELRCGYEHYLRTGAQGGEVPHSLLGRSPAGRAPAAPSGGDAYRAWIGRELVRRQRQYQVRPQQQLVSFITCAEHVSCEALDITARSLAALEPAAGSYEWVIVHGSSCDPAALDYAAGLQREGRARVLAASGHNIVGRMRLALTSASGRYLVPLEPASLVYPDCTRILAWHVERQGFPALLYSDHDFVRRGEGTTPYLKPDWDPVLFWHSGYTRRLHVVDRGVALMVEAYSDPEADCADWDAFARAVAVGHMPVHISEPLYSAGIAPDTAGRNRDCKPALQHLLAAQQRPGRFQVSRAVTAEGKLAWRVHSRPAQPPPMLTVVLHRKGEVRDAAVYAPAAYGPTTTRMLALDDGLAGLQRLLDLQVPPGALVRLIDASLETLDPEWPWYALALMELFPDLAMLGGACSDAAGSVLLAGMHFGFGDGCGSPDRGRHSGDNGYFGHFSHPHSVSAVSARNALVDAAFLADALVSGQIPSSTSLELLGEWLGAIAFRWGRRVAFLPGLHARTVAADDIQSRFGLEELLSRVGPLLPDTRYYSRHFALSAERPFQVAAPEERAADLERIRASARRAARKAATSLA